eukprot:gene7826-661_t
MSDGVDVDAALEAEVLIYKRAAHENLACEEFVDTPEDIEEDHWIYELLRYFTVQLNLLALELSNECTTEKCTEMQATDDWQFLCACHEPPKECSAISYIMHNLDQAESTLSSEKTRVTEDGKRQIATLARRLYRILAHAYYEHPACFDSFEEKTHLHSQYHVYVTKFKLMDKKHLIIGST